MWLEKPSTTHIINLKGKHIIMKKIKKFLKATLKVVGIAAVSIAVLYAGFSYFQNTSKVETITDTQSEYEERVDQKMIDSADEWEERHRVWAEQEVSKEIIAEEEAKLEALREEELSL